MKSDKTLYWLESQGRDIDEIDRSSDTGLCNRIHHWSVAQLLNKYNNYEYTIYIQPSFWPEVIELINLPNTKVLLSLTDTDTCLKLLEKFDEINDDELNKLLSSDLKLSKNNLYSNFEFGSIAPHSDFLTDEKIVTSISLKDIELNDKITDLVGNMVGIHMRRGRGIIYKNELNTLPDDIKDSYRKYRELDGIETEPYFIYEFIKDDVYFNVIDSILEINPNQKFYISHDLPDDIFKYYKDRYPNIIYTKEYFYDFIENRYQTQLSHVKNVIDLFSLSNTKYILGHPMSTWSSFASQYKEDTPFCMVNDDIELILNNYNTISKKLSHS